MVMDMIQLDYIHVHIYGVIVFFRESNTDLFEKM